MRFQLTAPVLAVAGALAIAQACAVGGSSSGGGGPDGGTCSAPSVQCSSGCVDTQTDHGNCGDCGVACSSSQTCSQGHCVAGSPDASPGDSGGCTSGETLCSGSCVNTQTDPNHCGNCTTVCLSGLEACMTGTCTSTCTGGQTLCIPDGGVVDGGPTAHCADLMTSNNDCGSCFNACMSGWTCTSGTCTSTLLGSGTAADPWHTATALANCKAYLTDFPTAMDGVYTTHPSATDIGVYCDMKDGGITYEDFGFGQYSGSYTGYTATAVSDFTGTVEFTSAFSYLYDRNGGLTNVDPGGWTDSNCCIVVSGGSADLGLDGVSYMYPAVSGAADCATTYSASYIQLTIEPANTVLTTITQAQAANATSSSTCALSGNPAIFVKKY